MEMEIERKYDSGPFGDETTNYLVGTSAKIVGDFIKLVLDNFKNEWGEVCIRQNRAPFDKMCVCAYNRGKIIRKADNYEAYANARIRSIRANGGWGSMGYDIEIDDFDSLPKQTSENFQMVYFGRVISKK